MTYSIRRMHAGDLDQVQDIDREAFPTQWPAPNYRQELTNKLAYYLVLSDDARRSEAPPGNPAPVVARPPFWKRLFPWVKANGLTETQPPPRTEDYLIGFSGIWLLVDEAHVTNIAVRLDYQSRGLGEYLLLATFDLAASLHASILTLEVRVSNEIARRLYAKYGFAEKGVRKGYYLDNREDALIMTTDDIRTDAFRARLEELRRANSARLLA